MAIDRRGTCRTARTTCTSTHQADARTSAAIAACNAQATFRALHGGPPASALAGAARAKRYGKLAALVMTVGSCSLAMRGVDPAWDGKQEPVCSESYTPVLVDGMIATSIAGAVAQDVQAWTPLMDGSQLIGAVALSVIFTVSAAAGASNYKECRVAKADWIAREAIRESAEKARIAPGTPATSIAPAAASTPARPSAPVASTTSTPQAATTAPQESCEAGNEAVAAGSSACMEQP